MQLKIQQYKGIARLRKTLLLIQTLYEKGISSNIGQGNFVAKADAMPYDMAASTFSHYMKKGIEFGIIKQDDAGAYRLNRDAIIELERLLYPLDPLDANPLSYKQAAALLAPFATFRGWLACIVVTDAVEINLGGICYACNLFCEESGIKAKSGQPFHFHQGNMSATMKALIETGIIGKRKQGRDSIHFVADAAMLGKLAGLGKMYFKG